MISPPLLLGLIEHVFQLFMMLYILLKCWLGAIAMHTYVVAILDSHHCEVYECETGSSVNEPLLVISSVLSLSLILTENRALNLCATLCCIFGFITAPF